MSTERYDSFTPDERETGLQWLRDQGEAPWAKRLWIDGDWIKGDMRGVPPFIRETVLDYLDAIGLMTADQYSDYWDRDIEERVQLVDQVLAEAGR